MQKQPSREVGQGHRANQTSELQKLECANQRNRINQHLERVKHTKRSFSYNEIKTHIIQGLVGLSYQDRFVGFFT